MASVVRLDVTKFIKIATGQKRPDGSDARWTRPARAGETPTHAGLAIRVRHAAQDIGCDPSTLSRILRGEAACGGEFIANLLDAIGPVYRFDDVFRVEPVAPERVAS